MSRPGVWFGLVAFLIAGLLLVGPVLWHPTTHALGAWESEAAWHMWRHAAWLRTFATEGPWLRMHEEGLRDPGEANLSPATTLLGWPAWWIAGGGIAGVTFAWNMLFVVVFVGAVAGTWDLVRAWLPRDDTRMAAAAAAAIVAFGAFLHQAPGVGRQENIIQFLWPLHIAFLYRATVLPGRRFDPPLAAASFALITMQGGFPALFTAIVELPAALWCLAQASDRKRAFGILTLVAVAGAVALYPWVYANRLHPPPSLSVGRTGVISVPLAQLLPGGADVPFARGWHEAPYPGLVALLAAAGAAVMHRASRFWFLLAAAVMLLMIGPEARWTLDASVLVEMPVSWLSRLPGWTIPSTGWARLGTFVPTLLALAIAPALVGRPRVAALVAVLAVADQLAYIRSVPRTEATWELALPAELGDPDRPSVWLPLDERGLTWLHAADEQMRRCTSQEQNNTLPTLRWVEAVLPGTPEGFVGRNRAGGQGESPAPGCVERDAGVLADAGFARIVLLRDHGDATEVERVLRAGLGAPVAETDRGAAWVLASSPGAVCDLPIEAVGPRKREESGELPPGEEGKRLGRGRREGRRRE
ncbi:MAG: hypothetical protein Q8P18_13100 [Pseudomonadota bacterium]|nr:hypothetical protein [Pseudomonadota bacterium]